MVSRVAALERFGGVEVLWDDLLRRGTRQPAFRVVRAGTTIAAGDVTRRAGLGNTDLHDVVAPNNVVDRYRRGDTVVLQGLHHTNPHLARLANNLALALDHPVQVNAYLSPASRAWIGPALRLPRRVRGAARRLEAVARLGAAAAHHRSGEGPALDRCTSTRRARRPVARSHPRSRRLPLPSPRLSACGGDDRPAFRPPHDRVGGR